MTKSNQYLGAICQIHRIFKASIWFGYSLVCFNRMYWREFPPNKQTKPKVNFILGGDPLLQLSKEMTQSETDRTTCWDSDSGLIAGSVSFPMLALLLFHCLQLTTAHSWKLWLGWVSWARTLVSRPLLMWVGGYVFCIWGKMDPLFCAGPVNVWFPWCFLKNGLHKRAGPQQEA